MMNNEDITVVQEDKKLKIGWRWKKNCKDKFYTRILQSKPMSLDEINELIEVYNE